MTDESADYDRQAWSDYQSRQAFEHQLIDRKTVWFLTTQGLLFTAYGVVSSSDKVMEATRRQVVLDGLSKLGVFLSVLALVGVGAMINSKRISWRDYRNRFGETIPRFVPKRAWARNRLPWGVRTSNTLVSLIPDLLYPVAFGSTWLVFARGGG